MDVKKMVARLAKTIPMPTVRITWFSGRIDSTFKTGLMRYFCKPIPRKNNKRGRNEYRKIRIDMEEGEEPVGDIHGYHHEFAMSKIDDLHHTHDEGHAEADEGIETPQQNAGYQCLQEELYLGHSHRSSFAGDSIFLSLHRGMGKRYFLLAYFSGQMVSCCPLMTCMTRVSMKF